MLAAMRGGRTGLMANVLRAGVLLAGLLPAVAPAGAATPPSATLAPDAGGAGSTKWTGTLTPGTNLGGDAKGCFGADRKPDPTSGCDFFTLVVPVPDRFYDGFLGGVEVSLTGFAPADLDLGVFRLDPDGARGNQVAGSGAGPGEDERSTISAASGSYVVAVVNYLSPPGQSYTGKAEFKLKRATPSLPELNAKAPPGQPNFRASHDQFSSHSEPTIAMDPLDHNHLVAGSKMYESLSLYLFKIGTYESFDGGRTWKDEGHLPGYCQAAGQCDPTKEALYRTVSDISLDYDDEGNAYANTLDAPGGTAGFTGFNITVHVKPPGQGWSTPITVHNNRTNLLTQNILLDDKNWLAVDNNTDVNGAPNKPGDGKIGTIYTCWSLDSSIAVPLQQIVLMRSTNGGKTWGGVLAGDNIPLQLSQKGVISGIGCHIAIGPRGEVYVHWYDNQLDAIMQVKSTDRGKTFTPARPVATIGGVNEQFEGQSFRNLSIPSTAVASDGTVYVVAASRDSEGAPLPPGTTIEDLKKLRDPEHLREPIGREKEVDGKPGSGADIVLFKSTNGGTSYTGPARVNQDAKGEDADQFQPWLALTPKGQLNVSYFDRRNDPNNFFIDTYLSRSNDRGKTFTDVRVSQMLWDPRVNPPVSVSGEFIGDYQGIVADDQVAIPFWNDTQANNLDRSNPGFSPYQEVYAARVENTPGLGGPAAGAKGAKACLPRKARVSGRAVGRARIGQTQGRILARLGQPRRRGKRYLRYCVKGGGSVLIAFSTKGRARLVAATARGYRARRVGRGATLARARRAYRGARTLGSRILVDRRRGIVIGLKNRKVRYIAGADRQILRSRRSVRAYLRVVKL